MDFITSKLAARFPDVSFIVEMFQEMRKQGAKVAADSKYYPNSLLLAVLFRLQARQEAPFKVAGQDVEGTAPLLELLGFYWNWLDSAAVLLREGLGGDTREEVVEAVEEARKRIAAKLEVEEDEVPEASVSELQGKEGEELRIEDHCPDYLVMIDSKHQVE